MTLMSVLGKYDRKLRGYLKRQLALNENSEAALLIMENFSVLSSAICSAKGFLSRYGDEGLLPLFFMCRKFLSRDITVNEESITAYFSSEMLTVLQSEALFPLLFSAAVSVLCDRLYDDSKNTVLHCLESLTMLRDTDSEEVIRGLCRVDKYLREDPSSVYEKMNNQSRRMYRFAVKAGAEKAQCSETDFVKNALASAINESRHIGFFLPVFPEKKAVCFIALSWVICGLISLAVSYLAGKILFAPFLIVPLYFALKPFTDRLIPMFSETFSLPCFGEDVPYNKPFAVSVCTLLPEEKDCGELYFHLKRLKFSTKNKNVRVILLCDRKNSVTPVSDGDDGAIAAVKALVDRLNRDFSGGFSLFVRDRVFSVSENEYTGFERKRGAICELCRYIKNGDTGSFGVIHGDVSGFPDCEYLMTLDSDTTLSFDSADKLIATASHPLNRPVYSREKRRITKGYGIIAPRIEVSAEASCKSLFSKIHTFGGSEAYSAGAGERCFSLFGESVFCGKGLIDIDAFYNVVCDRFDEGRILSHDIPEGAVLRTGFSGESEVCEAFPSTLQGYYSRLHRWIRGDVQNLKYLFFPLGGKSLSPCLSLFGKYVILENALSASAPVIAFVLLIAAAYINMKCAQAMLFILLFCFISRGLYDIVRAVCERGFGAFYERYSCHSLTDVTKGFYKAFSAVCLAGVELFVRVDALLRGAYRSLISKRHLLQWKTAAASDKNNRKTQSLYAAVTMLYGLILILSGNIPFCITGAAVVLSVPFFIKNRLEKTGKSNTEITEKDRVRLKKYIADMWQFFSENVTAGEHFLPPDNVWEVPAGKKTSRTSPTNFGLYLVSILAVYDAGIIDRLQLLEKVGRTLDTIELLPKYRGHFYNWYDTRTAKPVTPLYVSAVDCGNFIVCLVALKEGLREIEGTHKLTERIEKIISSTDLSFFSDERRGLFRIGFDAEKDILTPSCYDLYMSEARMTSYFAVAKRQVPSRFWADLGRTSVKNSPYVTAGSWSGTMFEHFMPSLFLAHPFCSFEGESLRGCLYAQKRAAEKYGIPYGFSESCFYDEASDEKYGYKAIGTDKTGLKPDMKEEAVVSPYSTFLTLGTDAAGALKNLRRLEKAGAYGKYGFYEAVDYREDSKNPRIIRCFMAHHTGMSIVAAVNFLYDGIFIRRFMRDSDMDNARGLLYEKLPRFPAKADRIAKKCRKKL